MLDFNDAEKPRVSGDLLPDGWFAPFKITIKPGGIDGPGPQDKGLLTQSKSSDAQMLDCELTVMAGLYVRRKVYQTFTVKGGSLDEKGQSKAGKITKNSIRAMLESRYGLKFSDTSPEANARRQINGYKDLDGLWFIMRVAVEPPDIGSQYSPKNAIGEIISSDHPLYADILAGRDVPPEPFNKKPRAGKATASAVQPGWGGQPDNSPTPGWNTGADPTASAAAAQASSAPPTTYNGPTVVPQGAPSWVNG